MTTKHIKISDSAKDELRKATINGNRLDFAGALKNYAEIKKLMPHLGITWSKKDKTHYVEPDTQNRINEILGGAKIVDEKKTLQAFYTPEKVAQRAVQLLGVECCDVILEPSAGSGNLIRAIKPRKEGVHVIAIEVNEDCRKELEAQDLALWVGVRIDDFLTVNPDDYQWGGKRFDKVLMNPPYDKNTWVEHLEHSWKFLKDGGRMVAICPNNEDNRFYKNFIEDKTYKVEKVEAGAFAESGTQIGTMILIIDK